MITKKFKEDVEKYVKKFDIKRTKRQISWIEKKEIENGMVITYLIFILTIGFLLGRTF